MLTQLIHHGVVVSEPPSPRGLTLIIRGEPVTLTPKQEEMALAWAKKQGTPYVEDPVFVRNFMHDFSQALGIHPVLRVEEVDFGPAVEIVAAERQARERMTREERKALTAERKARREALRQQYGYAIVNGERVELGNYLVEPSGIFMGRGQHPLRGRWKEGVRQEEITLNLSPDAPRPPGQWGEIVWQPDSLWVARWQDKLSGKLKYVWLSETAPIKQEREAQKFDRAHELHDHLEEVRTRIQCDLSDPEPKRRKLATVCYLIDVLCLRVGDEKDPDEADTVGATTLRPEHVKLRPDGTAEFRFLGKDSVLWHKTVALPEEVRRNLEELIQTARPPSTNGKNAQNRTREKPQLFPDISSRDVNAYLSEILPGLTAKVFRTHHATVTVQESLSRSGVGRDDPEHVKWEAASRANHQAAVLCNHTKKVPVNWARSRQRHQERRERAEERVRVLRERVKNQREVLLALRQEARASEDPKARARVRKRIEAAERRLSQAKEALKRAQLTLDRIKTQGAVAAMKRTWNLGTSLKSYIDPRVYYEWGQQVGYDVLEHYYPAALRNKFAWVRNGMEDHKER